MACPYGYGSSSMVDEAEEATSFSGLTMREAQAAAPVGRVRSTTSNRVQFEDVEDKAQEGVNKVEMGFGATYSQYLQLDKVLSAQALQSEHDGKKVDDEHLFIIIHQTYELWFKQIIFELDIIRKNMNTDIVDEMNTLKIVSRLERIVRILKLLVDQILVLETMSPLDFVDFRQYLTPASGFQSLQFRLLENKLGVRGDRRIKYNAQHYKNVFHDPADVEALIRSEEEPSLLTLVERWLERTPGLKESEKVEGGEGFWPLYERAVQKYLKNMEKEWKAQPEPKKQAQLKEEYSRTVETFKTILDSDAHEQQILTGMRTLSHDAMKGALMIYFYRDFPRFSQPYQFLTYLMDIDSLFTKWRYNHVILVQRMLGNKQGTGGSSGYLYLRSTVSDKYKVFLDIFNLSTWLIPREYIPTLSPKMVKTLSSHSNLAALAGSSTEDSLSDQEEDV